MTEASAIVFTEENRDCEGAAAADFETIFIKHYARIAGVLFRIVGNRAQAEELADDVFLKLHRQSLADHSERGVKHNWGGWLYRTATRLGIDALRSAARRNRYEMEAVAESARMSKPDDPLDDLLRAERRARVRDVLALLKPAHAQILILRSSGFSYLELAEALGVKLASIGTMLARAETEFEKRYCRLHGDEEEV